MKIVRCVVSTAVLLGLTGCVPQVRDGSVTLTPTQIADRARPATIVILAEFDVKGTVPSSDLNVSMLKDTLARGSYSTKKDALEAVFNAFLESPGDYLREGDNTHFEKKFDSLGTGFIVTPDGYILTNAHVVQPEEENLKQAYIESLAKLVNDDVTELKQAIEQALPGETITDSAANRLKDALARFYVSKANIDVDKKFTAVMPSAQGDVSAKLTEKSCEVAKVGVPTPGKDVAVLKIEGSDLPTVPLAPQGHEADTKVGDELLVFGYPGKVVLDSSFTQQSRMQPSLSLGHVSGTKRMAEGWEVIQTDTSINPGNSGGPVMNDHGQVVGLATYGMTDSQNLNFAVSIDVAWEFLNTLNVHPGQSAFSRKYNQALVEYDKPGHGDAHRLLSELHEAHPDEGTVSSFLQQMGRPGGNGAGSEAKGSGGSSESAPISHAPSPLLFVLVGAGVLGLLALIISSGRR